nr:PRAME family member 8-like [Microcebus murinus]
MSLQAPPRLLQLAGQSLLRDEAVAIPAVKELPRELFPQLFMEAFTKRQRKVLTAMVQAWPFTHLPVGSLLPTPDLETLRAVLDGLDVLLAQKVRPSGRKLQVLDLRDVDENFWNLWSVWSAAPVRPSRARSLRKTEDYPCTARQRPLQVVVDLLLGIQDLIAHEFLTYLCEWAQQRKDSVHLCCRRLDLYGTYVDEDRKIFEMVDLSHIQHVEVHTYWDTDSLEDFFPYLIQKKSVRQIILPNFLAWFNGQIDVREDMMTELTTKFFKLDKVQKFKLQGSNFLVDHLKLFRGTSDGGRSQPTEGQTRMSSLAYTAPRVFAIMSWRRQACLCLGDTFSCPVLLPHQSPLTTAMPRTKCLLSPQVPQDPLEVLDTECWIFDLQMHTLFMDPIMHQPEELYLTGTMLRTLESEFLLILLEKVAATLQVLILEDCWMTDSQVHDILPSLSRCHQLMIFNFCGNLISKAILENLLHHILGLQRLNSVINSAPSECYRYFKDIYWERYLQLWAWLMEILRDTQALRKPEVILLHTLPCRTCGSRASYDLEPSPCSCGRLGGKP